MTIFEDRKDVFEKAFVKDGTRDFEIEARAAKFFGFWAAKQLGLEGEDINTYAREVITANLKEPGFNDIYERIEIDFDKKELDISRATMEAVMRKSLKQAQQEIASKDKSPKA